MTKKLILDCPDDLWRKVNHYKIDHSLQNNNDAVVSLLKKALGVNDGNCE